MINVIYEDNHLLVVDKPPGLPTQPSQYSQDSLEEQAKLWIKAKYNKPGNVYLHAIHRLDRSASGIVVFAKTSKALSRLNEAIRNKQVSKVYWAWVQGNLGDNEGTLAHRLIHDDYKARILPNTSNEGKKCLLHYKVIKKEGAKTLLEINLETGRYHQIRAQLAAVGCPILGDVKYGSTQSYLPDAIALQHIKMTIPHPVSGETLTLISPQTQF